jgi:flagellar FliL protein
MKKNMLTIIVIAVCVINMALTSIMMFVMMPAFSNMNNVISQVVSILNLELESENSDEPSYSIKDIEVRTVTFDEDGKSQTINLAPSGDGNSHFGILTGVKFELNTTADDYSDVVEILDTKPSILLDVVKDVIASFKSEDISEAAVKEQALARINDKLNGSKCIVNLTLDGFMHQ